MSAPPPPLKDWSKRQLIREVERLRAVMREHAEQPGDDPREAAATEPIIDVAGDPHAIGGAVLDMRAAVLMESVDVALVDTKADDPVAMMLALAGRINYSADRVEHAYLFGPDGAAAISTQLIGIAGRAASGPGHAQRFAEQFADDFGRRMRELP